MKMARPCCDMPLVLFCTSIFLVNISLSFFLKIWVHTFAMIVLVPTWTNLVFNSISTQGNVTYKFITTKKFIITINTLNFKFPTPCVCICQLRLTYI
jgi:hypothetical protein